MIASAGRPLGRRLREPLRLAWLHLAAIYGVVVIVVARTGAETTSHEGARPLVAAATLLAVVVLGFAAVVAVSRPVALRAGLAAVALGMPIWAGWTAAPDTVQTLALALAPFAVPLALDILARAVAVDRLRGVRLALVAAYLVAALAGAVLALLDDPFLDADCYATCWPNELALAHVPRLVDLARVVPPAVGAIAAAAILVAVLAHGRGPRRTAALAVAAAAAGGLAIRSAALLVDGRETAGRPALVLAAIMVTAAALGVGAVVVAEAATAAAAHRDIDRLIAQLDREPSLAEIELALRRATDDPTLRIVPASAADAARAVTALGVAGTEVLVVEHDPARQRRTHRELRPAIRLLARNAHLRASLEERLAASRAARSRIVATGDAERERIERDLHDGTQQGLLALLYGLNVAAAEARDPGVAHHLGEAADDAARILDDLREIAHGIHPAVLSESGLPAALRGIAATAPIAVELGPLPDGRYPGPIERAAYHVIREAVANAAAHAAASHVAVDVRATGTSLDVRVSDGGRGGAVVGEAGGGLTEIADRVAACGGQLTITSTRSGTVVEALLPCGS